ncbi:hypothetical protein LMH87_006404 [Akanthomyces muscarius]|uniref:Uncharacterized protein n=1 Tax=Akanthomyces muscarius TaxID=2231603 RepID=A0A9W8QQT9_AKAMU|nr:hypothetical protein LMH87_006404 [Akanthomyces muscarius]KAJ4164742.1 hypothetical protein LMH87_006404 [Akanthomyces muscarius]
MPWTRSVGCRRQHLHSGGASRTHQHRPQQTSHRHSAEPTSPRCDAHHALDDFKAADSGGVYVVLYAVIGTPIKYAQDPALATKSWEWTETQLSENGLLSLDSMPR